MPWQPIETAPKDGTPILVLGRGPQNPDAATFDHDKEKFGLACRVLHWFDGHDTEVYIEAEHGLFRKEHKKVFEGWRGHGTWLFIPTHWQPLPEPPVEDAAAGRLVNQ